MNKSKKLTNAAVFGTLTLTAAYGLNRTIFYLSRRGDHLYSPNGQTWSWRFGNIFYTKQGTGSPLLLIHDCTHLSSEREFMSLVSELSETHTVYTLDLLGCGRSEKPKMTYTNFLYVQLINDFTKNVIGGKTHIMATGNSAAFVIMACQMEPSLYRNLLFINPTPLAQLNKIPTKRHKILKYLLELPIIGTLLFNIRSSYPMIRSLFHEQYYNNPHKVRTSYLELCHEASHKSGSASKYMYASLRSYFLNFNIVHALKNINNSIYILMGENEKYSKDTLNAYMEINPAIESSIIPHTKHLPHLESPKDVLSVCDIFF